ncbi:MAG: hypothetical protein ACP5RV_12210 [Thiomonas sp.]
MNKIIASCRSPRVEVVRCAEGFRSRAKVTRTVWMESAAFADPSDAMAAARRYIREASLGRVDPYRALKPCNEA